MNIVDWAVSTMDSLGALGVALLIFLENLFPPIPSEVILPLAGVAAAGPNNTYWAMLLASISGSTVGAWLLYGLGRLLGPERLRTIFLKLPLLNVHDYDKTVDFMDKHGHKAIFFGRMVPGVRSLISIPAGLYAMPLWTFTLLTVAGSTIWNTVFLTIGYYMGSNWTVIEPYTDIFSNVVYAIIALIGLVFLVQLIRREVSRRRLGLPDPDAEVLAQEENAQPSGEGAEGTATGPEGRSAREGSGPTGPGQGEARPARTTQDGASARSDGQTR
ncbi:DedA family protein [Brachybacterium sacelli]|uniref:Membrane protein DedA with SNARE-associated domain n=1 Tax=Brachybacterium sacelli TaxID=173364 RepID=A0ABS4X3D7_9MICO|nr:DedA family protein [Brachybacterium sacelli]MBP2382980.1 membrane protein DedA with SNARE-associated domain [Brachybacterium sacelli]